MCDAYLTHVLSQLPPLGDDPFDDDNAITEVEVGPDGALELTPPSTLRWRGQ